MSEDLEKNDPKKPNQPSMIDRLKELINSKTFVYGALSGVGLLCLKYYIYDNFISITETEQNIKNRKFTKIHFGDNFMVGMH